MNDPKRAANIKQTLFIAKLFAFLSMAAVPLALLHPPAAVGWAVAMLAPAVICICRSVSQ